MWFICVGGEQGGDCKFLLWFRDSIHTSTHLLWFIQAAKSGALAVSNLGRWSARGWRTVTVAPNALVRWGSDVPCIIHSPNSAIRCQLQYIYISLICIWITYQFPSSSYRSFRTVTHISNQNREHNRRGGFSLLPPRRTIGWTVRTDHGHEWTFHKDQHSFFVGR